MIVFGSIVILLYLVAIGLLIFGYQKVMEFNSNTELDEAQSSHFSIIIPFRNEAKNLSVLLNSIQNLNYPENLYEIIFVNDESMDDSVAIILNELKDSDLNYKIIDTIRKSASPKKDAISEAINISQYDWILTTDADCKLPINWLLVFNEYIQKNDPLMIVGPVQYFEKKGLINQYQQLDNYGLQSTTIGAFGLHSPLLCNGANLAYKKEEFHLVSGFSENNHIASGDDIFLLEKFKKRNSKRVLFIKSKDAIVITLTQDSWKDIINQRIRWASKTTKQDDNITKMLGVIVFLTNMLLIFALILCLFNPYYIIFFIGFLTIKTCIDYLLLLQTSMFFRTNIKIPYFLINTFIYPIITVIVVLKSLKGDYIWKGRNYN